MKKIIYIFTFVFIGFIFSSCEVVSYMMGEYSRYVDNTGNDPLNFKTRADAWQQGSLSQGVVFVDAYVSLIGDITGEDVSQLKAITDGTINDLAADPNLGRSEKANLVGGLFCIAGNVTEHFEKKAFNEEVDAFYKINSAYSDENSPWYDPYFDLRYDIDYDKRVIRKRDSYEVVRLIREHDKDTHLENTAQEMLKYGLIDEWQKDEFKSLQNQDRSTFSKEDSIKYNEYRKLVSDMRRLRRSNYDTDEITEIQDNSLDYNVATNPMSETMDITSIDKTFVVISQQEEMDEYTKNLKEIKKVKKEIESTIIDQYVFDAVYLTETQRRELDVIAEKLLNNEQLCITIVGHTCDIGSKQANHNVGMKRAIKAKEYLVNNGIRENRIKTLSAGASQPLQPNVDANARKINRRISFVITTL
ncbi:MAG: OmpA family protein [Paludibacteraceae bacterium]|nr:OmpA family protein [Paludibacteraceae bacterium]